MTLSVNPVFSGISGKEAKVLERVGKYKSNSSNTFSLKINSNTPKTYNLDCISFNNKGENIGEYHQRMNNVKNNNFAMNVKNVMSKLQEHCEDNQLLKDVSEFFESIAK